MGAGSAICSATLEESAMKRVVCLFLVLLVCSCASLQTSSELSFEPLPVDPSDNLSGVLVTAADLSFTVYRDAPDEVVAEAAARDLARGYRIIAEAVGVSPAEVTWAQVALSRDPQYQPPRHQEVTRWTVPLDPDGTLGPVGRSALYHLIPHEQVHSVQRSFGSLPRWYAEGMAVWAGFKATSVLAPRIEAERRAMLAAERRDATEPPNLMEWGGVSVKPEAVLRQMTPEQRERKAADPSYSPPGPFSFTPDDFVSDESNTGARYAASLALFEAIEAKAGTEQVTAWIVAVGRLPDPKKSEDITRLAKEVTGVDIATMLN